MHFNDDILDVSNKINAILKIANIDFVPTFLPGMFANVLSNNPRQFLMNIGNSAAPVATSVVVEMNNNKRGHIYFHTHTQIRIYINAYIYKYISYPVFGIILIDWIRIVLFCCCFSRLHEYTTGVVRR